MCEVLDWANKTENALERVFTKLTACVRVFVCVCVRVFVCPHTSLNAEFILTHTHTPFSDLNTNCAHLLHKKTYTKKHQRTLHTLLLVHTNTHTNTHILPFHTNTHTHIGTAYQHMQNTLVLVCASSLDSSFLYVFFSL